MPNFGLKTRILGKCRGKIHILSTHNLLCRTFALVCQKIAFVVVSTGVVVVSAAVVVVSTTRKILSALNLPPPPKMVITAFSMVIRRG